MFFLIYGSLLFLSYIFIGIFSSLELTFYINRNKHFNFSAISDYKQLPTIAIIAPSYNEEATIIENIRSLLALKYPGLEIIVVNDGSKDRSLEKAIAAYDLVKVDYAFEEDIKTQTVRAVYKSTQKAYASLTIIDKENGGKADALNAGINCSRCDLFLAIDVDCIIEPDAIPKMVKPFLEEANNKRVIASGGVIRVANSCKIENGQIVKVNFPTNLLAQFQTLEYFRAFTLGRMAWSKINGLLIISGAFGLFDRELVVKVGGYDTNSVGEDLELVVRMRKYMQRVEKQAYKVAFIPDPLCWTEVPTSLTVLYRQRNRWTRGLIDTLIKHRNMMLNPRYGKIGMLSYPYWFLFEWLAPIIEVIGISYFIFMVSLGRINLSYFLLFTFFVFSFSLLYSSFAVFYEKYVFNRYKDVRFLFKIFSISIIEMLIYHPLNTFFALKGNIDFFFKKNKKSWGQMTRTGFKTDSK